MSAKPTPSLPPLVLICGGDEFAVQQRARQIFRQWAPEGGTADTDIIEARVSNAGEALRVLGRVREALQTLPFFGSERVVWLRDCNFLGDDRTAGAAAVTEALAGFAQELKTFRWTGVRLLISAGKVDRRRVFFKTIESAGACEEHAGLSFDDRDWAERAESHAQAELAARSKRIAPDALAQLVATVGPNLRQLSAEAEKLSLYAGDRPALTAADVAAVVSRGRHARSFALAEALGDRDLTAALRALDEELWEIRAKIDRDKSAIGLLYGLISKVRLLLILKELIRLGHLRADLEYGRVKPALARIPEGLLPAEKRYNPVTMHAFPVSKALAQTRHYTLPELVQAMEILLTCNQRLVTSTVEESIALQQALVAIIGQPRTRKPAAPRR